MLRPGHPRRTPVLPGIPLLALAAMLGMLGCDQSAADKKAIQTTIERMKKACEDHDGSGALTVYNRATFEHYGKVVPGVRTRATRKPLTGLDGKGDELSMLPHQDRDLNEQCNAARVSLRDFMMEFRAGDDMEKPPMSIRPLMSAK